MGRPRCPRCGQVMRRLYVSRYVERDVRAYLGGSRRRSRRSVPVGWACLRCRLVVWDEGGQGRGEG